MRLQCFGKHALCPTVNPITSSPAFSPPTASCVRAADSGLAVLRRRALQPQQSRRCWSAQRRARCSRRRRWSLTRSTRRSWQRGPKWARAPKLSVRPAAASCMFTGRCCGVGRVVLVGARSDSDSALLSPACVVQQGSALGPLLCIALCREFRFGSFGGLAGLQVAVFYAEDGPGTCVVTSAAHAPVSACST